MTQTNDELTNINSLLIQNNLVSKGISYFYNKVNVEGTLNVGKKITFGSGSTGVGNYTISSNNDLLQIKNGDFSCLDINSSLSTIDLNSVNTFNLNTRLSLNSKDGYSSLKLGDFKIESTPKGVLNFSTQRADIFSINNRGQIEINSQLEVFGGLKSNDFRCTDVTCGNLTVFDTLSIKNDITIDKEKHVIFKAAGGLSPPTLGTRSTGTKLVFYPTVSDKLTDYAIGLENGNMWFSVPMSKSNFGWKFYSSDKNVFSISGDGAVNCGGAIACDGPITCGGSQVPTFDSGRIQTEDLVANWFKIKDVVFVEVKAGSPSGSPLTLTLPFPVTNKDSLIHPNVKLNEHSSEVPVEPKVNSTVTVTTHSYLSFSYS